MAEPKAPEGMKWSKGRKYLSGGRVWIMKHPVRARRKTSSKEKAK